MGTGAGVGGTLIVLALVLGAECSVKIRKTSCQPVNNFKDH